jgi:ATP-dependent RNA helicase RhlE
MTDIVEHAVVETTVKDVILAPEQKTVPAFAELGLKGLLLKALAAENYENPTPIQTQAIPAVLDGKDIIGIAQTGTGKTAAFALPILQHLFESKQRAAQRSCLALILCPTRELARQIHDSFRSYGRFMRISTDVVFGGMPIGKQVRNLQNGVDVLIATPGRLLDLVNRRALFLDDVKMLVLDEADHMLDLGFVNDIRKIVQKIPKERQSLFFSATMPKTIQGLADELLNDPVRVAVTPESRTVDKIDQKAIIVDRGKKQQLLETIIGEFNIQRGLIFCRTKHGADKVVKSMQNAGIETVAIHGNKSQAQRERALRDLKCGEVDFLVATDIAARGIDIDGLSHVINFDIPDVPEAYVHRIGRTARAGKEGMAISLVAPDEMRSFRDIERTIKKTVEIVQHELSTTVNERSSGPRSPSRQRSGGGGGGYQGSRPRNSEQSARPERSYNDRVRSEPRSGERNSSERNFGERPQQAERNYADRAPLERTFNERPQAERNGGERNYSDRPQRNERPQGERSGGERNFSDRPQRSERPQGERNFADRPQNDRPQGGERHWHKPQGAGKPSFPKPSYGGATRSSEHRSDPRSSDQRPARSSENRGSGQAYAGKAAYGDKPNRTRG